MSIEAINQGSEGSTYSKLRVSDHERRQLALTVHSRNDRISNSVVLNKKSVRDLAKKLLAWAGDDCEESSVSGDL